jgi:hypothetical protein
VAILSTKFLPEVVSPAMPLASLNIESSALVVSFFAISAKIGINAKPARSML